MATTEIVQAHVIAHHRSEHLQTCNDTVTGRGFIQQNHMTGVLCTQTPALLLHLLQYITVTDFGTGKWNAADIGLAYDGDGDRIMMIDHLGDKVDGDQILYIIAREALRQGQLRGGVVGTLISEPTTPPRSCP